MADKQKEILMFRTGQRLVHWLHTSAFAVLMITGVIIYLPVLGNSIGTGAGGHVVRLLHRIGAVAFMLVPICYLVFDPKEAFADLRRIFTYSKEDQGWLRAAPRYYFFGDAEAMPPQGKFNAGQKLFYLTVFVCMVGFIVTGLIMWFGKGTVITSLVVPTWMFQWSVFLHDLCTIAYGAFFLVHFVLAVAHPVMKGGLDGMLFGWMSEGYVRHHHPKYYEELQSKQ